MRLDLSDLRLFLCIIDAGSITQGAIRAHLALASASERLRKIEDEVGVPLLIRQPRGVITTEAGEALAHHARLILRQQDLLKGELHDFATGTRGTLTLYANTAALSHFLPQRLAVWLSSRPQLRVELKERTSEEIVQSITVGVADAGIVSDAIAAPHLHLQPVAADHLLLIVPPDHRLAQHTKLSFADVVTETFVGLSPGNALQDHIDMQARTLGHVLQSRIQMKTFEGMCEMVQHGIGVAILPKAIATQYQRRYTYKKLALTDEWATRQLCVCYQDWDALGPPLQSLLTHLGAIPKPH
ncbi:LysR substrate-binding domain-containing protein [Paenalcaligenes sp. Me52]|uniref:LysR substrate-binding domain-containing protein n=1 Tax=Paenalcaligenes sp. Me52 TaxID=3392038 RepID=UPI003D26F7DF